jgi:hypothetical protein
MYCKCEQILLKAATGKDYEEEFLSVTNLYSSDLQPAKLKMQLKLFADSIGNKSSDYLFSDIVKYFQTLSKGQHILLSDVVTLVKLILVMPATNAASEHFSFRAMKRVKTYLSSNMGDERLTPLMLLHIHKERTDGLDLVDIANTFADFEHRKNIFGVFNKIDMSRSRVLTKSVCCQSFSETCVCA